ncbi:MAG: 4-hydroxy-tetrahydrodipicolinate reductase [Actinobacteria bacterium]|nr:4-hydroxy-tetrahydrodipicolinate reductase [Actinomycetota bacterium]
MTRVVVTGANGRMGRQVVQAVTGAPDMELVAQADPELVPDGATLFLSVDQAIAAAKPDVAVDFTVPDAAFGTVSACLAAGVHCVVGTTGMTDAQMAELTSLAEAGSANLIVAANFAVGAVLMMRFAEEASRFMESAEIVELHHSGKIDAPSGTAAHTAEVMHGDVPIHSVRLPGMVAHQEVILGGLAETLSIRHDSLSRECFMPGVLMAIRAVPDRPGLTRGIAPLMFG